MAPIDATAASPLDLTLRERMIRGTWTQGIVPDHDLPRLLKWYRDDVLRMDAARAADQGLDDVNSTST